MYRQTSYASVAAGAASAGALSLYQPTQSATSSHMNDTEPHTGVSHHSTSGQSTAGMDMDSVRGGHKSSDPRRQSAGHLGFNTMDDYLIVPTYLRNCRYIERLHAAHKIRLQRLRESRLALQATSGLGSRTPSSNNLRLASAYSSRIPVQDVIERSSTLDTEDELQPLPSRWSETDKYPGLEVLGDGAEVKIQGVSKAHDDAAAVRTDHPMPKQCGIYYFEVTILSRGKEGLIGIGFSGNKPNLNRPPGWETDSWGYHGDDGFSFACSASGKPYGPKFSAMDTIGCGFNFKTKSAFFTKNGIHLGDAFHNVHCDKIYPSVGIKKPGEHLRVNLGQLPFVFNIDAMVEKEKMLVMADIDKTDMSRSMIIPGLDESATIQELVSQYLTHEGFVETARQFTQDIQSEKQSFQGKQGSTRAPDLLEDVDAVNRQKIRAAILEGDIDHAFKYLQAYYPHVLTHSENRDLYFRLRCRKFIEMIRLSYDPNPAIQKATTASNNGSNEQMDIDDQLSREANPKSTLSSAVRSNDLLTEAIQYGMALQAEFSNDPRPEVKKSLNETFALIAYTDARESVLAGLMEGKGRVEIAEGVNGAILVSLGKPRSALLEKLCQQTEVLVDMLADEGGAGAFVNMREDFLS